VAYDDRSVKPMSASLMRARVATKILSGLYEEAPTLLTSAIRLMVELPGGKGRFGPPYPFTIGVSPAWCSGLNGAKLVAGKKLDMVWLNPSIIPSMAVRGVGPFRWVALSGDPEDIARTDAKVKELLPDDQHLHHWLDMAKARIQFQGLPARICWVGLGDRHRLGLAFNDMVMRGELKAPIVIGRDHLDSGSVASPNRETEGMKDGSDAVSDWPLLNALLNTASGATWVSLHHGGGVGMGFSQHAGVVIVCDGTEAAAKRIARVLWNDPATGVMRHADAGYDIAVEAARKHKLDLPGILRGK